MWRHATHKVTSLLCRTAATVEQKKPLVYHEPRGRCLTESEEASERSFRESINDRGSASAFTVSQHFPVLRTVTRRHDYKSHAECWVCGPSGQPTQIYFASSDFDDATAASCFITSSHARRTTSPTRGRSSRLNADVERNSLPSLNVRVMLTLMSLGALKPATCGRFKTGQGFGEKWSNLLVFSSSFSADPVGAFGRFWIGRF